MAQERDKAKQRKPTHKGELRKSYGEKIRGQRGREDSQGNTNCERSLWAYCVPRHRK